MSNIQDAMTLLFPAQRQRAAPAAPCAGGHDPQGAFSVRE